MKNWLFLGGVISGLGWVMLFFCLKGERLSGASFFKKSEVYSEVNAARQLRLACDHWAIDHGGEFPPSLECLFSDGILPEEDKELLYRNPADPVTIRWAYESGLTNLSDGEEVLISSLGFQGEKKVAVRVNGSVKCVWRGKAEQF